MERDPNIEWHINITQKFHEVPSSIDASWRLVIHAVCVCLQFKLNIWRERGHCVLCFVYFFHFYIFDWTIWFTIWTLLITCLPEKRVTFAACALCQPNCRQCITFYRVYWWTSVTRLSINGTHRMEIDDFGHSRERQRKYKSFSISFVRFVWWSSRDYDVFLIFIFCYATESRDEEAKNSLSMKFLILELRQHQPFFFDSMSMS